MNCSILWEMNPLLDGFLLPEIEKDGESLLESRWGSTLVDQWSTFKFKFLNDYGSIKTNFHFILGYIPVVSEDFCSLLDFKTSEVELLPIRHVDGQIFYVLNPCFCDNHILNEKKSKIKYDPDGNVLWVSEPVFNWLPKKSLFKIPDMPTKVYVDDLFVKIVQEHKLQGVDFVPRKIKQPSFITKIFKGLYG